MLDSNETQKIASESARDGTENLQIIFTFISILGAILAVSLVLWLVCEAANNKKTQLETMASVAEIKQAIEADKTGCTKSVLQLKAQQNFSISLYNLKEITDPIECKSYEAELKQILKNQQNTDNQRQWSLSLGTAHPQ